MKPPIHDTAAEKPWRCSFFGKVSERSVEIYCGFRFRPPLYSTVVLNLNRSLGFSSTLSFCTFLKKYQKQGSRVRHSALKVDNSAFSHPVRCKLCLHCARLYAVNVVDLQSKFKSCFATSFSRCTPRRSLLVAMLGVARTRCAQTSCHLFPSIARLLAVPPNAAH